MLLQVSPEDGLNFFSVCLNKPIVQQRIPFSVVQMFIQHKVCDMPIINVCDKPDIKVCAMQNIKVPCGKPDINVCDMPVIEVCAMTDIKYVEKMA